MDSNYASMTWRATAARPYLADQILSFEDRILAVEQAMGFQNEADKAGLQGT